MNPALYDYVPHKTKPMWNNNARFPEFKFGFVGH